MRLRRKGGRPRAVIVRQTRYYELQLQREAEALRDAGYDVELIHMRQDGAPRREVVNGVDVTTLPGSVKKTSKALIVHEDVKANGVGAEVAAVIGEGAFEYLDGPITRLAGPDAPAMPFAPNLEAQFLITPEKIADAARRLARY